MKLRHFIFFLLIGNICLSQINPPEKVVVQSPPPPMTVIKASKPINYIDHVLQTNENDSLIFQLAFEIENAVNLNDVEAYFSKLDTYGFRKRIETHLDTEKIKTYQEVLKGIHFGLEPFSEQLTNSVSKGTFYNLVNYRFDVFEETYYLLFRLYNPETGINYHDYRICKTEGKFYFNDIYIYLSGEHFSELFSNLLQTSIYKNENIETPDKLNFELIAEAELYYKQKEYKKAFNTIKLIDKEVPIYKNALILKSVITKQINNDLYLESLQEIENHFGDDAKLSLILFDYYFNSNDLIKSLELIDNLLYSTGDSFLNYYLGKIYFNHQNYEEAAYYFKIIVQEFPDLTLGYIFSIDALIPQKKFDEVCQYLDKLIEKKFHTKTELIKNLKSLKGLSPEHDLFLNSKEFKKWK